MSGHTTETAESASPYLEGPNLRVKASIGGTRTENNRGGSWNVQSMSTSAREWEGCRKRASRSWASARLSTRCRWSRRTDLRLVWTTSSCASSSGSPEAFSRIDSDTVIAFVVPTQLQATAGGDCQTYRDVLEWRDRLASTRQPRSHRHCNLVPSLKGYIRQAQSEEMPAVGLLWWSGSVPFRPRVLRQILSGRGAAALGVQSRGGIGAQPLALASRGPSHSAHHAVCRLEGSGLGASLARFPTPHQDDHHHAAALVP